MAMSSIKKYLSPINPDDLGFYPSEYAVTLGSKTKVYTPGSNLPPIPKRGLVLLGVEEDRGPLAMQAAPRLLTKFGAASTNWPFQPKTLIL